MSKVYSIISHTHWDREWYLPFEQFRLRLTDLMDNLLNLLESDKEYRFHLDAQTVVLEDYLEIRPQKRRIIEKFVKEGRLLIGPWYVQNDFHLTSGEATVRNLLIGSETARSFGKCTEIGYMPDQFGLISQLPQILNGFGIDACIFGRGYKGDKTLFIWESEDGSTLLSEHLASWYNNLQRLPSEPENALNFIRTVAPYCFEHTGTDVALLMNGVDHLEAQENLTEIIRGMRPLLNEDETVLQDTMPEHIERIRAQTDGKSMKRRKGELRDGGAGTVLTGTLSSRVHLKQQNYRLQAELEGELEPTYSLLSMTGACDYPLDRMRYLWKSLIKNHPHDSICGCSVDAVHRHMEDRNEAMEEFVSDMQSRADEQLLSHLDRTRIPPNAAFITCFNASLSPYNGVLRARVEIPAEEDHGGFTLCDKDGKNIPFEVESIEKNIGKRILSPINLPGVKEINRYTVLFKTKLPQMTVSTLVLTPNSSPISVTESTKHRTHNLENEFLKVSVDESGCINILNKKSGRLFKNAIRIEDDGDIGDLYTSKLTGEVFTSEGVNATVKAVRYTKLTQTLSVSYNMRIERGGEKHILPIEMLLTLNSGSKRLDIKINTDNRFGSHRTRLLLQSGIDGEESYALQPFDIVKRGRRSSFENDECHPCEGLVGIEGDGYGIALMGKGLYEYEHKCGESGVLALTLLRCTDRIATYMAEAGTPEGQCIRKYSFELSVYPYEGDRLGASVCRENAFFKNPPHTAFGHADYKKFVGGRPFVQASGVPFNFHRPLLNADKVISYEESPFRLTRNPENAIILSAFKGAESGNGHIIRLFNLSEKETEFTVHFSVKAMVSLASLSEKPIKRLPLTRAGNVTLKAEPKKIITLLLK